ncbi:MAG: MFS transporter, partial [Candidatus Omnitrophota bacterium]
IPAISLVFIGGYVADHYDRRKIILITRAASFLCAVMLVYLSWRAGTATLAGLYTVIFLAGVARGFADPANTAFEAQIVPKPLTVNAASWISSTWITCAVLGPAVIGFIFDSWGAVGSYLVIAACFLISWLLTHGILPKPQEIPARREPMLKAMVHGWKFVFSNHPLLGAMA